MTYLTPDQLCERFPSTTKGYWAQMRYRGAGPRFMKLSPKKVLYAEADVMEWAASSERSSTSGAAA